jgi:hypothetical protein
LPSTSKKGKSTSKKGKSASKKGKRKRPTNIFIPVHARRDMGSVFVVSREQAMELDKQELKSKPVTPRRLDDAQRHITHANVYDAMERMICRTAGVSPASANCWVSMQTNVLTPFVDAVAHYSSSKLEQQCLQLLEAKFETTRVQPEQLVTSLRK